MKNRTAAVVPGIILILLGACFLLQQFAPGLLSWGRIWPVFPTLVGAAFLAGWLFSTERDAGLLFVGTLVTLVGLFFFAFTYDVFEWADMARLWPAFPTIVGLAFLALFAGGGFREWPVAGVGCLVLLVGAVAFGFTLLRLPRALGDTLIKFWPLGLIFLGLLGLATAFFQRRD
jgi:hypothetical protein